MKQQRSVKLHTLLFIGFLLLGILSRGMEDMLGNQNAFWRTVLFLPQTLVFSGLILFWIQSLLDRLLPTPPRTYMLMAGWSMLFLLIIRAVRYRLSMNTVMDRLCWYLYYVPLIIIAALFLMCCICFSITFISRKELYLLCPCILQIAGILTNDLHFLAFRFSTDPSMWTGDSGSYTYGPLYYLVWTWIGMCIVAGVFLLLKNSGKMSNRKKALVPFFFLLLIPVLSYLQNVLDQLDVYHFLRFPEIYIFCMIGVYESCIRNDLLPHNENYIVFFTQLSFPIVITNRNFVTVFAGGDSLMASKQQLQASLTEAIYLDEDTRLQGNVIRAGFTFWIEDESSLHRLQEQLEEVNETLSLENTLLRYENEQKEEQARIAARNAIYRQAASQVYQPQKDIAALLAGARPGTAEFRDLVARVSVQNAYVKRKTNLVLFSQTQQTVSMRELYLALKEVADFLGYCGILSSIECRTNKELSLERAIAAFDTFACLLQKLWENISLMLILLSEYELQLAVNCPPLPHLPAAPCRISQTRSEEQLRISITLEEGGRS